MPLGFHIYPDLGLLFIRAQGAITQDERMRTMLAWLRDPQYQRCVDALFDVTTATTTPTVRELRELAAMLDQNAPGLGPRKLAVVTAKPIAYAMATVFGRLMQLRGLEVKVFLDSDRAWQWLRPESAAPFEPR